MGRMRRLLLIFCICIFLICIGMLILYYGGILKAQEEFQMLAENKPIFISVQEEQINQHKKVIDSEGEAYKPIEISGCVGWLSIEGTDINYPVMQNKDDSEYYLHRDFYGNYSYSGTPFLDSECNLSVLDNNLVIYAHNMKDGSMFGGLKHYRNKDYLLSHPIITFESANGISEYEIFALLETEGDTDTLGILESISIETGEEYENLIEMIRTHTLYDTQLIPQERKKLCFLITCTTRNREGGRLILIGHEK